MSKGTKFTQQSYKVADTFPFEWIKKKWKEGFHITSLATGGGEKTPQWAVVMSRSAGFSDQCIELDFQYPSEGIHRRWDGGIQFLLFDCPCLGRSAQLDLTEKVDENGLPC